MVFKSKTETNFNRFQTRNRFRPFPEIRNILTRFDSLLSFVVYIYISHYKDLPKVRSTQCLFLNNIFYQYYGQQNASCSLCRCFWASFKFTTRCQTMVPQRIYARRNTFLSFEFV